MEELTVRSAARLGDRRDSPELFNEAQPKRWIKEFERLRKNRGRSILKALQNLQVTSRMWSSSHGRQSHGTALKMNRMTAAFQKKPGRLSDFLQLGRRSKICVC